MKKTFISDLTKFNKELGNYYQKLVNGEYDRKPECLNELFYSFCLGRYITLDEVNIIYQTASTPLKKILLEYFEFYNQNIKIDISKTLLKNFNNDNIEKLKEEFSELNITTDIETLTNFTNKILEIRTRSFAFCGNNTKNSNEISECQSAICDLYKIILSTNYSTFKSDLIRFQHKVKDKLVEFSNIYLYLDKQEINDLSAQLHCDFDEITVQFLYDVYLEEIMEYFAPLNKEDIKKIIKVNFDELIGYVDYLNLMLSKVDYSLLFDNEENMNKIIYNLCFIFSILRDDVIEEEIVALKQKEYYYKLILKEVNRFIQLDSNVFTNFVKDYFTNKEIVDKTFYSFLESILTKFNIIVDDSFSNIFNYLLKLYNSAYSFFVSPYEISIKDLDVVVIKNILLKYLNINYIGETIDLTALSEEINNDNFDKKDIHKYFSRIVEIVNNKIDLILKTKQSINSIIETNLKSFLDCYELLVYLTNLRSKFNRLLELGNSKKEKKYIENFSDNLSKTLDIDKDFLESKMNDKNITDEVVLILNHTCYDKFKMLNDELVKLNISNTNEYKFNIVD